MAAGERLSSNGVTGTPLGGRVARLGERAASVAQAVVPDPFVIAIGLSALTLLVGWLVGESSLLALTESYAAGMMAPGLLAFALQMALILVTGHAFAAAPVVRRALARLAEVPRTPGSAVVVVSLAAMGLGLLNWGLGLVGGAFVARAVGLAFQRRGQSLNYAVLGAAGYMGMLVWHGGLSGSAPLTVASEGAFGAGIDVSRTLFSPLNLATTAALLLVVPLVLWALSKTPGGPPLPADDEAPPASAEPRGFVVTLLLALPVLIALVSFLVQKGTGAIDLSFIILAFLAAGLLLHRGPMGYARAFTEGSAGAGGILLQFPLYFGILAVARDSGLLVAMAGRLASLSVELGAVLPQATTAAWATFCSAAFINLLVPSGGGQWALQAPVILESATSLGLERARLVMAFSYGDELTNLLQPFWALPLLSITGLKARDVLGYTLLVMLVAVPLFLVLLAIF